MATKQKYDKAKADGYKGFADGYRMLNKDIKSGALPRVMLLCGDERFLVQWFVNTIIKKYVNQATAALDVTTIDEKKFGLKNIQEAADTVSMLSDKRVVLVEDFFYAEGKKKKKEKQEDKPKPEAKPKAKAEDHDDDDDDDDIVEEIATGFDNEEEMAALCDYLKEVPDSTLLIFTCGIPDLRTKFVKAVQETGKVYALKKISGADLQKFIEKRLNAAGKTAKPEVITEIIKYTGYNDNNSNYTLLNLENDINKIIALSKNEYIRISDVSDAIAGNLENDIFKLLDAITGGRKDEAYRLMFNNLAAGTGDGSTFGLLAMIIKNIEMILFVKEMRSEGMNLAQCQKNISAHPYAVKKAWGFSDRFTIKGLKNMCRTAYEIDSNVKKGLISDTLALEMFIANV